MLYNLQIRLFLTVLFSLLAVSLFSQIINLGCFTEQDATIGVDRKDWNMGSTASHSEGYLMNFGIPANSFGVCKKITQVEIVFTINSVDQSGLDPSCGAVVFFTNIYLGCGSVTPASCPTSALIGEIDAFPASQTLTFTCPPVEFPFGDVLAVDIVPALGDVGCPNGQSAVSSGDITIDYEICVMVTVSDDVLETPLDLGNDITVCELETTNINASPIYDQYSWSPNGEIVPNINVGEGTYTLMVTDVNGCTGTDVIKVIESIPTVSISENDLDNTICSNASIELTANTAASNILWSTNQTTQMITVGAGSYSVVVTDDNSCTAQDMITIDEHPEPQVTISSISTVVCGTETIELTATSGFDIYDWDSGDNTAIVFLSGGIHNLIVTDQNGCTATASIQIFSEDAPNAGNSASISVCNGGSTYNIQGLLGVHDAGGTWDDLDDANVDLNVDPFNASFLNVAPGNYSFEYTVTGTTPCPDDAQIISVTVEDQPDAGTSTSITICSAEVLDFFSLLGAVDLGGTWTDINGSGVDLSDPSSVMFAGVPMGSFTFSYEILGSAPCTDIVSNLVVEIGGTSGAGDDVSISVCAGALYNLEDAITVPTSSNGTFADTDGTGALSGTVFNSTGFEGQILNFEYEVDGGTCGIDQATISVEVVSSVFAGIDNLAVESCIGDVIEIFDLLPGASQGGTFTDLSLSGAIVGNQFDTEISGSGTFLIQYNVGDDVVCDADSAHVEIIVFDIPEILLVGGDTLCTDECNEVYINLSGMPGYNYSLSLSDDNGDLVNSISFSSSNNIDTIWVCNSDSLGSFINDTIFIGDNSDYWSLTAFSLEDMNCNFFNSDPDSLFFLMGGGVNLSLDTTLCFGEEIIVGNDIFDMTQSQGQVTVNSVTGCDTIIDVNVAFYDEARDTLDQELCSGQSILVNGNTYDETNPTGTEVLIGQSANSCDSTVVIMLDFVNVLSGFDTILICQGDSAFLENAWQFDEGSFTENLLSAQGCDSIAIIELSFYTVPDGLIDSELCSGQEIIVNGTLYNEVNPSGQETLIDQSVNGCDSTVIIELSFVESFDITNNYQLCQGDSVFLEGAWQFAQGTFMDMFVTSQQCDSMVTTIVSLSDVATSVIDSELCNDASIIVNGTVYDINNPSGEEILINQAVDGCDSTVTINLDFSDVIDITSPANICEGDSVFLEGAWQFDTGTYVDNFTTAEGCDSIVTTNLMVESCTEQIEVSLVDINCAGASSGSVCIEISTGQIPYVVSWSNNTTGQNGNLNITNLNEVQCITNLPSGSYTLVIEDGNNIEVYNEQVSLEDLFLPLTGIISIINNPSCEGDGDGIVNADISGGAEPYNYDWTPDSGNQATIENLNGGLVDLVLTDDNNCILELSVVLVEPEALAIQYETNDATCFGESNGSIIINGIMGGDGDYITTIDDVFLVDNMVNNLAANNYVLEVIDGQGCSVTEIIIIEEQLSISLSNIVSEYTITQGDSVQLTGSYDASLVGFSWLANESISCIDCMFPVFTPASSQSYFLTVVDANGCIEELVVNVNVVVPETSVYIPTIFSPNRDGVNDTFDIFFSDETVQNYSIHIFDRWGNLVYTRVNEVGDNNGWDGSRNGKQLSVGVYTYLIEYVENNEQKKSAGSITMIR